MQSSIPLLVADGILSVQDLGRLACTNRMLCRYITVESDEDIWSHVLRRIYPSTDLMPIEVLDGVSPRVLCKRLTKSQARLASIISRRDDSYDQKPTSLWERHASVQSIFNNTVFQLEGSSHAMKNFGPLGPSVLNFLSEYDKSMHVDMTPLLDPVLEPSDIVILLDIYQHGKAIFSIAMRGDADESSLFGNDPGIRINIDRVTNAAKLNPIDLDLKSVGTFGSCNGIKCKLHFMRVPDYRVVCLMNKAPSISYPYDSSLWKDTLGEIDILPNEQTLIFSQDIVGVTSTSSSRNLRKITLSLGKLVLDIPRSPYHHGYKYTVSKHREFMRNNDDLDVDFGQFRMYMWDDDAITKPDLSRFFELAKSNGCFGNVHPRQKKLSLSVCTSVGDPEINYGDDTLAGITLLHILSGLFHGDE